jgi:hypothetical protein
MKTLLQWIGGIVAILAILGAFNIGHFVLTYSPNKITCTEESK